MCASHVSDSSGGPPLRVEPVERRCLCARYEHVSRPSCDVFHKMACHGYLSLGLLTERHAYGVAYPVCHERAHTDRAFYASVLALASLRHTEMERIVHVFGFHAAHEQPHRAHHHHRVRRLDRYHHIVERLPLAYAQELHAALHDAFGRVTVARHDAVGQRSVVHSYAYGSVMLPAYVEERHETRLYLLQFGGILLVGVFQLLERPRRVNIVAGVYAHLLRVERGYVCHVGIEVHVCHERRVISLGAQ